VQGDGVTHSAIDKCGVGQRSQQQRCRGGYRLVTLEAQAAPS